MGCTSKSSTHDLTIPEIMSFLFCKTTSAPMYVSHMIGVGSSSHCLAWRTPFPSSSSHGEPHSPHHLHTIQTQELNNPLKSTVWLLVIPALNVSIGHMILFSSSGLFSLSSVKCLYGDLYTHLPFSFRIFAHNAGPISMLRPKPSSQNPFVIRVCNSIVTEV